MIKACSHEIKNDIRNLSYEELIAYLGALGEPSFRATQIFSWLYQKGVVSFKEMVNLPSVVINKLDADFAIVQPVVVNTYSSVDGTMKVAFQLHDQQVIETVLIPTQTRATVCVSTQAGCKFGCRFCASGIGGWKRNLTPAEILDQIVYVKNYARDKDQPLTHIVFMGVGEPMTSVWRDRSWSI